MKETNDALSEAVPSPAPFNEESTSPPDQGLGPSTSATETEQESGDATDEYIPPRQSPQPASDQPVEGSGDSADSPETTANDLGGSTTLAVPSFTLGGTVYTAAETLTSDQGLGGYIYSGVGGSGSVSTAEPSASP